MVTNPNELRLSAYCMSMAGLDVWGNLCSEAADTIDTLRAQLAEAQAALKTVMRNAELSKEPCGSDHESPAAIRNGKFAGLTSIAAQGLGMVRGPSLTEHLVETQRDAEVNRQINRACAELPDDYRIVIEIERDAGWVCLLRGGEDVDFDDPCEGVASSISAAIDAARGRA